MTLPQNIKQETMTQEEIKVIGIEALFQRLGAVGMVRFLQQFQTGWGDYTRDRESWLDQDEDVAVLAQRIISHREVKAE